MVYYNENDGYCCKVLRARIDDGGLPAGWVDERDIRNVRGSELAGFKQIHLFAGIGGFPLGCRMAGMPDDFSIITGGFPCQDISTAGKGAGLDGERSGLWFEMLRIIREVRPRYVFVENVPALLGRGLGRVLGGLAEGGLDYQWDCLPASLFGLFHNRLRFFLVAYPQGIDGFAHDLLEAGPVWRAQAQSRRLHSMDVAKRGQQKGGRLEREPQLARLVHRVPNRLDRLKGLGNAVVPQVVAWIAARILEVDQKTV